ncbi:MAG: hypothetical protein GY856_19515, partial [bacterium]|nr:hypothetical protein [bacterium]
MTRFAAGFGLLVAVAAVLAACGPSRAETGEAADRLRSSSVSEAIHQLEEMIAADPEDPQGDRAALMLGHLLLRHHRPAEALAPLRRGAKIAGLSGYARLLLVRAVVEGNLVEALDEAAVVAAGLRADADQVHPSVREEASFLLAKLRFQQRRWQAVAGLGQEFLGRWKSSRRRDEVRWLMAQAQIKAGLFTAAHASLETIWFESPRSPWSREAKTQLRELESRNELRPRRLTDKAQYEFIQALRAAGLHAVALEEITAFRQRYPGYPKTDGALFLKAMSHYWERENEACVETV